MVAMIDAVTVASEMLSFVWFEAAMFSCAIIVYLAFSGGVATLKVQGKVMKTDRIKSPRSVPKDNVIQSVTQLDRISGVMSIPRSQKTLEKLAKAYAGAGDLAALRELMNSAGIPLTKGFAKAVLEASALAKDVDLVVEVFERADPADTAALRAFAEEAAASVAIGAEDVSSNPPVSSKSISAQTSEIRALGRSGNLASAISLFERLPAVGGRAGTLLMNTMIDSCVECGDLTAAGMYLEKAQQRGVADAVSFNTLMKGFLAAGNEAEAHQVLEDLARAGVQATQASYHGLLHARVLAGDGRAAWCLVDKMIAAGVSPNAVTCSILLKMVTSPGNACSVPRILKLVEAVEDPIDEVLLTSILESCLRTGHLKLLSELLERNTRSGRSMVLTAPMYGSMIKAFGQARNIPRVWALWHDMAARKVQPTAITLGCMMEALVTNRCVEEAWQLLHETWEDEDRRHLVNTVTYTTLLKGFAREPEKVVAMYEEMKARSIECNTITYNTLLNAFAQCRAMHRIPKVLEDMRAATPPVEPDVVTYSTLIKGFCSCGNLDRALGLLDEVEKDGKYLPDEMMYNSLLDGCAKEQRLDEALRLVDRMRETSIAPSNYTLSMLVKLLGRCRKLGQAFSIVEALTTEFRFRPNIQVYTCLIQACFHNKQPAKATSLLDRILGDGLRPDEKTYTVLTAGLLQLGQLDKAAQIALRSYEDEPSVGIDSKCLEDLKTKLASSPGASRQLLAELQAAKARAASPASRDRRSQPKARGAAGTAPGWKAPGGGHLDRGKGNLSACRPLAASPPWRRSAGSHSSVAAVAA